MFGKAADKHSATLKIEKVHVGWLDQINRFQGTRKLQLAYTEVHQLYSYLLTSLLSQCSVLHCTIIVTLSGMLK